MHKKEIKNGYIGVHKINKKKIKSAYGRMCNMYIWLLPAKCILYVFMRM